MRRSQRPFSQHVSENKEWSLEILNVVLYRRRDGTGDKKRVDQPGASHERRRTTQGSYHVRVPERRRENIHCPTALHRGGGVVQPYLEMICADA
jgi:hypothetical protein